MDAVELMRRLHQHRAWVNGNLLAAAGGLGHEPLRIEFPIGQGSVWKSIVHMYAAEFVWLEALLGNEDFVVPGDLPGQLPGNQEGEGGVTDLADLRRKWADLEGRWSGYLAELPAESLEEIVHRKSASLGTRLALRRGDALVHVCTHAHYTAAQVVNMLRQAGTAKFPETMLISLARHEAN